MAGGIDRVFHNLDDRYAAGLRRALAGKRRCGSSAVRWRCSACWSWCSSLGVPFAGLRLPSELAPQEDRAFVRIFVTAPEGSSLQYLDRQLRQVEEIAMDEVDRGNAKRVIVRTGGFGRNADVNTGWSIACRSTSGTSATRARRRSPIACASARRTSPARAST